MSQIALLGNPNCGKTTLFNVLSNNIQRVGNWSGVTVEKIEGHFSHAGVKHDIVDLPGVYSTKSMFSEASLDERIAQNFLCNGDIDLIINVIDMSCLQKSLYLTTELLDIDKPIVIVLNMMDVAEHAGIKIDIEKLREFTGCPVIPVVASRGKGIKELKKLLAETVKKIANRKAKPLSFDNWKKKIQGLPRKTAHSNTDIARYQALEMTGITASVSAQKHLITDASADLDKLTTLEQIIHLRHLWIDVCLANVAEQKSTPMTLTDRLDALFLNQWLAFIIFLGVMYLVFFIAINIGSAFIDMFSGVAGAFFVTLPRWLLSQLGSPEWLIAFTADSVGAGMQLVAGFIPIIGCLFLCLAFLEDSGYMARVAFILDRLMLKIGLPGKAFIPLIVGFGCNVPAVMATRNLHDQHDRLLTTVMAPFMSCGARLTVYALFTVAFFPKNGQNIVFLLYITGVVLAILSGLVLRRYMLKQTMSTFIMELPAYHMPTLSGTVLQAWQRLKGFIMRAGKAIVAVVVVLNLVSSYGVDGSFNNQNTNNSMLAEIGRNLTPVFSPMGIKEENWPATVGIFTGIFAKEVVVGTLDSLYTNLALGESGKKPEAKTELDLLEEVQVAFATVPENIMAALAGYADPLGLTIVDSATIDEAAQKQGVGQETFRMMGQLFSGQLGVFCYLLFILIYVPCVATLGAVYKEYGSFWAIFSAVWSTSLAYIVAVTVYQSGQIFSNTASAFSWIIAMIISLFIIHTVLLKAGKRKLYYQQKNLIPIVNLV